MFKAFVSDLDDTLLTRDHRLGEKTLRVLSGLMERAENGEELRYLGTPAHFIRDADFGERYAGAV